MLSAATIDYASRKYAAKYFIYIAEVFCAIIHLWLDSSGNMQSRISYPLMSLDPQHRLVSMLEVTVRLQTTPTIVSTLLVSPTRIHLALVPCQRSTSQLALLSHL